MTPPRDAQRSRVYRAETPLGGRRLPELADCADFDRWLDEERTAARERAAAAAWGLARTLEGDNMRTDAGHHYRPWPAAGRQCESAADA